MCACKYIYTHTHKQYLHACKRFGDGRNSVSPWKSIFLTEFSDSTIFFSNLSIKLTIFYRANKKPYQMASQGYYRLSLRSTPTCPSRLGNMTEELFFPRMLFHSGTASRQMIPRSYLQLPQSTLLPFTGVALLAFLREGKSKL